MKTDNASIYRLAGRDALFALLVLGSLWGLSEVALGQAVRALAPEIRAGVLTGIGMACMGLFIGLTGRPGRLPLLALVTVLATQLCVPLLRCSPLCKANTSLAIMLHGIAIAGAVRLIAAGPGSGAVRRGTAAFAAALVSATVFYYAGMRLAPCAYLLSFNQPLGLFSFMLREGLVWAAFSAALFPAGYALGARWAVPLASYGASRPLMRLAAPGAFVALCWTAIAAVVLVG
ncbi:MAG: hypothetical protein KBA15_15450 [Spirochaetes bacterium]|nr:hypothetical protein [Spirochaetota bacterium]